MASEVVKFPEGGGMIIHRVRRTPSCTYCRSPGKLLCDFVLPTGKTCDRPLCYVHTNPKADKDYCLEHKPFILEGK